MAVLRTETSVVLLKAFFTSPGWRARVDLTVVPPAGTNSAAALLDGGVV